MLMETMFQRHSTPLQLYFQVSEQKHCIHCPVKQEEEEEAGGTRVHGKVGAGTHLTSDHQHFKHSVPSHQPPALLQWNHQCCKLLPIQPLGSRVFRVQNWLCDTI